MLVKVVECTRLWKSNGVLIFTVKPFDGIGPSLQLGSFFLALDPTLSKRLQEKDITETWSPTEQCSLSE